MFVKQSWELKRKIPEEREIVTGFKTEKVDKVFKT